jgi:hypothetical protein
MIMSERDGTSAPRSLVKQDDAGTSPITESPCFSRRYSYSAISKLLASDGHPRKLVFAARRLCAEKD